MLKNIKIIEVQPGTIFEDEYGTKRIYLGEFFLNMALVKVNQKSITIKEHIKEEKSSNDYVPIKRVIFYKIKGEREYNDPKSTTPDYIDEVKDINYLFVNNGRIVGIDTRFNDLKKNALEISIKNLQNQMIKYQGMSYISVSTDVDSLYTIYDEAIAPMSKALVKQGKDKFISELKKNRLSFPAIR